MKRKFFLAPCFGLLALASLNAQETPRYSFDLGGGFTTPVGNTGRHLDKGWDVRGGAGVNFSPHFGAMLNLGFDSFGVNSTTLSGVGAPGGDLHVFSARIDPIVHLNPKGHVDVYLTGGGGLYRRTQEFTQPTVGRATGFDPFFGFYPYSFSATQVLASNTVTKPGVDGGAGIAFGSKWHGKFFAEARYNRIFMRNTHTDYIPVTFGFRW